MFVPVLKRASIEYIQYMGQQQPKSILKKQKDTDTEEVEVEQVPAEPVAPPPEVKKKPPLKDVQLDAVKSSATNMGKSSITFFSVKRKRTDQGSRMHF